MSVIGIYKITNQINGKVYIGQTINYKKRSKAHFSYLVSNKHHNMYLQNAFNKHGKDAFAIELIKECSIDELDKLEIEHILEYNASNEVFGYNLIEGGQKYRFFSDDVKKRVSLKLKGRKFTDEHRKRISESQKGKLISKQAIEKMKFTKKKNGSHLGEKNPNALVSDNTAKEIVLSLLEGSSVKELSVKYETTTDTIYNIMYNKSYTHIMTDVRERLKSRTTENNEKKIEEAVQMYLDGHSQNKISQELKISRNTLRREFKKRNLDTKAHKNQFVSKLIPR